MITPVFIFSGIHVPDRADVFGKAPGCGREATCQSVPARIPFLALGYLFACFEKGVIVFVFTWAGFGHVFEVASP